MYVVRVTRHKITYKASLIEKTWSDDIMSNEVKVIQSRTFLFKFWAKAWAKNKLIKTMVERNSLEYIYG